MNASSLFCVPGMVKATGETVQPRIGRFAARGERDCRRGWPARLPTLEWFRRCEAVSKAMWTRWTCTTCLARWAKIRGGGDAGRPEGARKLFIFIQLNSISGLHCTLPAVSLAFQYLRRALHRRSGRGTRSFPPRRGRILFDSLAHALYTYEFVRGVFP